MTHRDEYISGLRKLADLLESKPDIPLPIQGHSGIELSFRAGEWDQDHDEQRAAMARIVRAFPVELRKTASEYFFGFEGKLDGLHFDVYVDRDVVCERVETTETVIETVPDPEVLESVPTVEVTKEVTKVEWVCPDSVLAKISGKAPA